MVRSLLDKLLSILLILRAFLIKFSQLALIDVPVLINTEAYRIFRPKLWCSYIVNTFSKSSFNPLIYEILFFFITSTISTILIKLILIFSSLILFSNASTIFKPYALFPCLYLISECSTWPIWKFLIISMTLSISFLITCWASSF